MALRGGELRFRPGPVFANLVLADEINRTPPKTQAALLEAMQEGAGDGRRRAAPAAGPVPGRRDAESDRVRGHVPAARGPARPLPRPGRPRLPVGGGRAGDARGWRAAGWRRSRSRTSCRWRVRRSCARHGRAWTPPRSPARCSTTSAAVVRRTRELPSVALGASPRAAVHLLGAAKASARLAGRDFVTPDDVAAHGAAGAAPPARAHAGGRAGALHARERRARARSTRCRCRDEGVSPTPLTAALLAVIALAIALVGELAALAALALAVRGGRSTRAPSAPRRPCERDAAAGALARRAGGAAASRRGRRAAARCDPPGRAAGPRAGAARGGGELAATLAARRRGRHVLPAVGTRSVGPLRLASWNHRARRGGRGARLSRHGRRAAARAVRPPRPVPRAGAVRARPARAGHGVRARCATTCPTTTSARSTGAPPRGSGGR